MKTTLTFQIPEEKEELNYAQKGVDYALVLNEIDNYLRSKLKYEELPEPVYEALQATREKLHSLAQEYGVEV